MATLPRRFLTRLLPLLALAGCNPAEYENRMHEAQKLLEYHDELHKILDGPVDILPTKDGAVAAIFLRPPLGINPRIQNADTQPVHGLLYRYDRAPTTPPSPEPNPALVEMHLAYQLEPGKQPLAEFLDDVQAKLPRPVLQPERKPRRFQARGQKGFEAETATFSLPDWDYYLVGTALPGLHVAVVYRTKRGSLPSIQKLLDKSAETLAVGEAAEKAHAAFALDAVHRPPR